MIANCANPGCSATFDYRAGRLYRFPKRPNEKSRLPNGHGVQHFWLCAMCCQVYTLKYEPELGVTLGDLVTPIYSAKRRQVIAAA